MKISVLTRHAPTNYGSLLQTIATQKVLERLGCRVSIIDYVRKDETGLKGVLTQLRRKKKWSGNLLKKLLYITLRYPSEKLAEIKFAALRRQSLNLTERFTTSAELEKYASDSGNGIYMTGSDQVWGRVADMNFDPAYFLDFVSQEKRRTAYAASFGKTEFTPEVLAECKKYMLRYNYITVRETSAVKILEEQGVPCMGQVLDPTLMMEPEEWGLSGQRTGKSRYVLVYQIHNNPCLDRYAKRFAKKAGLPLYRVSPSLHQIRRGGRFVYLPGINKFLTLFRYAEYIITDSFHGTALSIYFNRQFIEILTDEKTSTRNLSILKLTGLEWRIIKDYNDFSIMGRPVDYNPVNEKLRNERKNSLELLSEMIAG